MSKQLTISSAFAVFAMVAMTLSISAEHGANAAGEPFANAVVEMPELDWPRLPFNPAS